jgi:choline dehydrogenase-like flavoprotein
MSLVDARSLEDGTRLDTEICVVGAGAAGITLALRLAAAGREVLLVEAGGMEPDAETQALHDVESIGYPLRENYMARARQFGGTCNLWAGRCMRLFPEDVAGRPWVPESAWPIPEREIAAHYPDAAKALGLPRVDYYEEGTYGRLSTESERRLYAHAALTPTVSLWAPRPMRFGATHRRELAAHPRIRVLLHANATRLGLDESGSTVLRLEVATLKGRRLEIAARRFVLACGGLEVVRLLLVSNGRRPQGIGNEHGLVGRYFMEHPRAVFGKVRIAAEARLRLLRGLPVPGGRLQLGLAPSPEVQAREGLLNHYLTFEEVTSGYAQQQYDAAVQLAKVVLKRGHAGSRFDLKSALKAKTPELVYLLTPKELLPHWAFRALHAVRERIPREPRERRYVTVYFCEQPPDPESRVYLGDDRDALGMPRLVVDWRIPSNVTESVRRLEALLARVLQETGIGAVEPGEGEPRYTDASHHMGTTRMSSDPRRGVVDADCRVHGVGNLWIASSSVFPSAGHANPTLTIVALALRLAEHLRDRAA